MITERRNLSDALISTIRPLPNLEDRRSELFRLALWTTTRLGRARALRKRETTVATLGWPSHYPFAMGLHRFADMREVGFDLPLRNPQGTREPTSIPRTHPEQGDNLLS